MTLEIMSDANGQMSIEGIRPIIARRAGRLPSDSAGQQHKKSDIEDRRRLPAVAGRFHGDLVVGDGLDFVQKGVMRR